MRHRFLKTVILEVIPDTTTVASDRFALATLGSRPLVDVEEAVLTWREGRDGYIGGCLGDRSGTRGGRGGPQGG